MMSSPDSVVSGGGGGCGREAGAAGARLAASDMPLYCACLCRATPAPRAAQLMRVHVVTPKAPVHVTMDPKVWRPIVTQRHAAKKSLIFIEIKLIFI